MNKRPSVKAPPAKRGKSEAAGLILRSDVLASVRQIVESVDWLKQTLGPVAAFRIVVDANILIGDALWLLDRRRKPAARTNLQECIAAGTIIAYVTPAVVAEVEEKLTLLATKRGLGVNAWTTVWSDYKSMLHVSDPDQTSVKRYALGRDLDDAPTLALADMLAASGILTRDNDIAAMGGNALPIEFLLEARDYSRKAAVSISIRVGGYYVVVGASEAVRLFATITKGCTVWFRRQPPFVKLTIFLVFGSLLAHPRSRGAIIGMLTSAGGKLPTILLQLLQTTLALVQLAADNDVVPPVILGPAVSDRLDHTVGET